MMSKHARHRQKVNVKGHDEWTTCVGQSLVQQNRLMKKSTHWYVQVQNPIIGADYVSGTRLVVALDENEFEVSETFNFPDARQTV